MTPSRQKLIININKDKIEVLKNPILSPVSDKKKLNFDFLDKVQNFSNAPSDRRKSPGKYK